MYGNILVIFFLSATFLNWQIFLNFPYIWLFWGLVAVYFCLTYLSLLRQKVNSAKALIRSGAIALLLAEILLAFKFLPVSFYVTAVCLAIYHYLLFNLLLLEDRGQLDKKSFLKYLAFVVIIIFLILFTTVWL